MAENPEGDVRTKEHLRIGIKTIAGVSLCFVCPRDEAPAVFPGCATANSPLRNDRTTRLLRVLGQGISSNLEKAEAALARHDRNSHLRNRCGLAYHLPWCHSVRPGTRPLQVSVLHRRTCREPSSDVVKCLDSGSQKVSTGKASAPDNIFIRGACWAA